MNKEENGHNTMIKISRVCLLILVGDQWGRGEERGKWEGQYD
jgi:hypothetical protein